MATRNHGHSTDDVTMEEVDDDEDDRMDEAQDLTQHSARGQRAQGITTHSVVGQHLLLPVPGSGQTTVLDFLSLQRANGQNEPNYLQSNSELTINATTSCYVHTEVLTTDVLDVLEEKNMVILKGHPGSGKSFQGHAILRHSLDEGYTPHVLSSFAEWHSHVGEGRKSVVLMDGVMGETFVNKSEHRQWTLLQSTVTELIKKGCCRLVLTVYPHILRRLKQMEKNPHSLLSNPSFTVSLPGILNPDDKRSFLCVHLDKLPLSTETKQRLIETIVEKDMSGPVFGWCCDWLVHHWESLEESSQSVDACAEIFTRPAVAYVSLLCGMLLDPKYGDVLAAVLSLTMLGFVRYLHQPLKPQEELKRLGFRNISDDDLAGVADLLKEFILTSSADGFVSRIFYDAAGLALGRSHRQPVLLTVCDFTFILRYVRTVETAGPFSVTVGFGDFDGLSERLMQSILDGLASLACQHPDLANKKFLQAFIKYCETQKNGPQKLANVLDTTHHLPLLYWSVWSNSDRLCKWCLSIVTENVKTGSKELLSAILGILVFCPTNEVKSNTKEILIKLLSWIKTSEHKTMAIKLPFPDHVMAQEARITAESIKTFLQNPGMCYLNNPSLRIPHTLLRLAVKEDAVEIEMSTEHVHLVLRLLTDCDVDDTDGDGNTLLHLAAAAGNLEVITIAVKSGASITLKNKAGLSPPGMGHKAKKIRLKKWLKTNSRYDRYMHDPYDRMMMRSDNYTIHKVRQSCRDNNTETVKAYLCYSVSFYEFENVLHVMDTSLFHEACAAGSFDVTSLLIELGADVDRRNFNDQTALHYACQSKSSDIVKLLLEKTAVVNACGSGFVDILKRLWQKDAIISAVDRDGNTALHTASKHYNTDIIKLLLAKGSDINKKNNDGSTPLHIVCQCGKTQTASLLISRRANSMFTKKKKKNGDTTLHLASEIGCVETVKLFLDRGVDVNVQNNGGNSALHLACQCGKTECASLLISHSADLSTKNKNGDTPLHLASEIGCVETVKLVLDRGVDVNVQNNGGNSALHLACQCGKTECASLLISHSADLSTKNKNGDTLLHYASKSGCVDTVKLVLDKGVDVNAQNNDGDSALHIACQYGNTETASLLISHGADVFTKNENGDTPLHLASKRGSEKTVKLILDIGGDIHAKNNHGHTPLHSASYEGEHSTTVRVLLQHGADANTTNNNGETSLHSAIRNKDWQGEVEETLLLLLENGANVNTRDKNGNTVLHYIQLCRKSAVLALLNHGAEVNIQNADGNTPLHLACEAHKTCSCNIVDAIQPWLEHGADPNMKNARRRSPIDLLWWRQEGLLNVFLRAQRTNQS